MDDDDRDDHRHGKGGKGGRDDHRHGKGGKGDRGDHTDGTRVNTGLGSPGHRLAGHPAGIGAVGSPPPTPVPAPTPIPTPEPTPAPKVQVPEVVAPAPPPATPPQTIDGPTTSDRDDRSGGKGGKGGKGDRDDHHHGKGGKGDRDDHDHPAKDEPPSNIGFTPTFQGLDTIDPVPAATLLLPSFPNTVVSPVATEPVAPPEPASSSRPPAGVSPLGCALLIIGIILIFILIFIIAVLVFLNPPSAAPPPSPSAIASPTLAPANPTVAPTATTVAGTTPTPAPATTPKPARTPRAIDPPTATPAPIAPPVRLNNGQPTTWDVYLYPDSAAAYLVHVRIVQQGCPDDCRRKLSGSNTDEGWDVEVTAGTVDANGNFTLTVEFTKDGETVTYKFKNATVSGDGAGQTITGDYEGSATGGTETGTFAMEHS